MTEIVQYQEPTNLAVQMDYARAVSTASMLPDNYRGKPADIMLAVGLGSSMGLSPAESLYRIAVIKGKPTASAELIAANVRKAGHRLRVRGDDTSCTATVIRADDPDFEFTVTRDVAWARGMGLADQPNYKKQPGTMLQWRAITAVARLACPEALYGVTYTPDEIEGSDDRRPTQQQPASGAARMGAILGTTTAEQVTEDDGGREAPGVSRPEPADSPLLNTSSALAKRLFAVMGDAGITERDDRLAYASKVLGREIGSSKELTDADAETIIAATEAALDEPFPTEEA